MKGLASDQLAPTTAWAAAPAILLARGALDAIGFRRRSRRKLEVSDSLRRVEEGGIPAEAEARLRALGADEGFFASGLSVNEFALLAQLGPRPLAQVLGASVVRVGPQYLPPLPPYVKRYAGPLEYPYDEPLLQQRWSFKWNQTVVCELDTVTAAWNEVRRLALNRLAEEALQVYSDAVVGVRLGRGEHDWTKRTIDYLISGTAIRAPDSTKSRFPVLTDLSVQDYWRLQQAGYEPAGLVLATAVLFASASGRTRIQRAKTLRWNQEFEELSEAFSRARDLVRYRLESQARDCRAHEVVGTHLSHTIHRHEFKVERSVQPVGGSGWRRGQFGIPYYVSRSGEAERRGWVITMHGAATAVRAAADVPEFPPERVVRLRPA